MKLVRGLPHHLSLEFLTALGIGMREGLSQPLVTASSQCHYVQVWYEIALYM